MLLYSNKIIGFHNLRCPMNVIVNMDKILDVDLDS